MRTTANRLACATEPLIGRMFEVMHHCPRHDAVVSLCIQVRPAGVVQVDAILPIDGYRSLFKRAFQEVPDAVAFWRAQHLELFGFPG